MAASRVENGMRTLEVAMGSGEMFHRLIEANPDGETIGVDLSPNMAARSQAAARERFPGASAHCQSADARHLPFRAACFDAAVCCYLFELLPDNQEAAAVAELARVLRRGGQLTIILVAQNKASFNAMYRAAGRIAPAFWGRQVEQRMMSLLGSHGFKVNKDQYVRQLFYSSRVISAGRP